MKTVTVGLLVGWAVILCSASWAHAQAGGDASVRHSLWETVSLPGLTVGVDHERFYRAVETGDGRAFRLQADINSVFLGWPLTHWLQLYGSAAHAQVRKPRSDDWTDGFFRGRGGLAAHLWRLEVPAPEFMAGTVSLRSVADYSYGKYSDAGDSGHWHETTWTATLHYEILAEERPGRTSYPYSVDLYAGPIAHWVSGERELEGARRSFEQSRLVGLAFGANLFLTSNLSFGAHLRQFDTFMWRASARLTF